MSQGCFAGANVSLDCYKMIIHYGEKTAVCQYWVVGQLEHKEHKVKHKEHNVVIFVVRGVRCATLIQTDPLPRIAK